MKGRYLKNMSTWHEQMADAVRQRQHALNGIQRWLEKKDAAEKFIEKLTEERAATADVVYPDEPSDVQEELFTHEPEPPAPTVASAGIPAAQFVQNQ